MTAAAPPAKLQNQTRQMPVMSLISNCFFRRRLRGFGFGLAAFSLAAR